MLPFMFLYIYVHPAVDPAVDVTLYACFVIGLRRLEFMSLVHLFMKRHQADESTRVSVQLG